LTFIAPTLKSPLSQTRHGRYIDTLSEVATCSITSQGHNAKMAACIVHQNAVVSFGTNERRTHPFQARYGKNKEAVFLHAETSAIKNALKMLSLDELSKSTLYICRVKFQNESRKNLVFGMAKPCSGCFRCINTFGIQKVIFSLDNGSYGML